MKRAYELEYDTDIFGPGSLMIHPSHTNASRVIMANQQLGQRVDIADPEMPLVPTGYENVLATFSHMTDEADADYEIVAKFVKNDYNYVLIGFDKKNRRYHAWKRMEMEEHSEGFATRYNNNFIDSLEIGDLIKKGDYVVKSENFDKFMNYRYGRNVNVVYVTSTKVYEDGITCMNGAEHMFDCYRSHTVTLDLSDNEILLNLYGDDEHYQGIPLVGEKIKKGLPAVIRQVDNSKGPFALKKKYLKKILRGEKKKYQVTGRVIDIDILTNKDPKKLLRTGATETIIDMYDQQQSYYRDLYHYMEKIISGADPDKHHPYQPNPNDPNAYTYTPEFSVICDEAYQYIDASAYFGNEQGNLYGSTKIVLHILDTEHLIAGSKMVGRSGNKGVISRIIPKEKSWKLEDGTPIHLILAPLGTVGRLNPSQFNEHSINSQSATAVDAMRMTDNVERKGEIVYELLSYLNTDQAKAWKKYWKGLDDKEKVKVCKKIEKVGNITVVQPPIHNANVVDIAKAYEQFPPKFQHIVFPDGGKSMRKVECAKMFFFRLKQDPLEKYSSRSRGSVNPLTTLPEKSNAKKRFLAPFSDVPVRFGEMELEILMCMVNHPAAIADFMMENSTSFEAKLALSEKVYLGDPEDDITIDEIKVAGKKNTEWIEAMINPLGTDIDIETEEAPEGEWFYDDQYDLLYREAV